MRKKLLLSIVLAAVLLGLAFSVVDRQKFVDALKTMRFAPVVPVLAIFVMVQLVRVVRWWLLVAAVRPVTLRSAAVSALAGFLAINVFPLRAGELARPLLLRGDGVPFTSGVAAVLAERVLDALAVFALLLLSLALVPAREISIGGAGYDLRTIARALLVIFVPMAVFLAGLVVLRGRLVALVERMLAPLSPKVASLAARVLGTFVQGLEVFKAPARSAQVVALTLVIWGATAVAYWIGFALFELDVPASASVPVLGITMAGITVPAGIGMSGNFQVFCVAALALYEVDGGPALAYAVVMNVLAFGVAVGMGLPVLPFLNVRLTSLAEKPA